MLSIVLLVITAQVITSAVIRSGGQAALDRLMARLGPASLLALLTTVMRSVVSMVKLTRLWHEAGTTA